MVWSSSGRLSLETIMAEEIVGEGVRRAVAAMVTMGKIDLAVTEAVRRG